MNQFQKNMASRAGKDAKDVGASNTMSPSEVESSCMVVDELIQQGEEEYSFGLGQLFLEVEMELEVGMDTDNAKEAVSPSGVTDKDRVFTGNLASVPNKSQVKEGRVTALEKNQEVEL